MIREFVYPTKETVIFINDIVNAMSNRKADQPQLLKPDSFIDIVIDDTRNAQGDVYDKAAVLMRGLITSHGFASGNKRTGFITTLTFLKENNARIRVRNFNKAERIIRNIREFSTTDLAVWLRIGDIDEKKVK